MGALTASLAGAGLVVGDKSPLVLDASTDISLFLHSLAAICLRLSSDVSQSYDVSISLRLVPSLSISANIPMGNFPLFSSFMMWLFDLRCLARCP